jgi:hypothetical protein
MIDLKKIITKEIAPIAGKIVTEMKKNVKSDSALQKSIDYNVIVKQDKIEVQFVSNDYGIYVDKGRKPGKFVPVNKLTTWINKEGIKPRGGISVKSLSFVINRKIKEKGIKARPFINKSFKKYQREFNQVIGETVAKYIVKEIIS